MKKKYNMSETKDSIKQLWYKRKENKLFALVFATLLFSTMFYGLIYSYQYTPEEIRNDGVILIVKGTLLGQLLWTDTQQMSIAGDGKDISEEILKELPGIDPYQAGILSSVLYLALTPADLTKYMSGWVGERYNGVNIYVGEVVLKEFIIDFNNNVMGIPYIKFFGQLFLIGILISFIGGATVKKFSKGVLSDVKDLHGKRLVYKRSIGELVRWTDFPITLGIIITAIATLKATWDNLSLVTIFMSFCVFIILYNLLRVNSPWVLSNIPTKNKQYNSKMLRSRWLRDDFASTKNVVSAIVGVGALFVILYYYDLVPTGKFFSIADLTMKLMGVYLVLALIVWIKEGKSIFSSTRERYYKNRVQNAMEEGFAAQLEQDLAKELKYEENKFKYEKEAKKVRYQDQKTDYTGYVKPKSSSSTSNNGKSSMFDEYRLAEKERKEKWGDYKFQPQGETKDERRESVNAAQKSFGVRGKNKKGKAKNKKGGFKKWLRL